MLTITALYAGALGVASIVMASQAGRLRGSTQISIGDGGNREMLLAMRKHANFVEVVPLCLVLIGILELNGVTPYAVHGLGGGLLVFRIVHAVSLKADTITNPGRFIGAAGSALVTAVASVWAVVTFFV